jgi:hypothetical protein
VDPELRTARAAVLGLDTTAGNPPLIVAAAVYYVDAGVIVGGPFSYWSSAVGAEAARPDLGPGAVVEAHVIALLLATLLLAP